MRDGRRNRLGLVNGSEGTVGDSFLDNILNVSRDALDQNNLLSGLEGIYGTDLTEQELTAGIKPTAEAAGTPLHRIPGFEYSAAARDFGYLPSTYKLYLSGGFPEETIAADTAQIPGAIDTLIDTSGGGDGGDGLDLATSGVGIGDTTPTNTALEQNLLDQGVGVQAEPGAPISAPGEGMLTQEAIDDLADYPITNVAEFPTGDASLATQIAAEDRAAQALADEQADEQALINLEQARTGQYDTPTETYIDTSDPDLLDLAGGELGGSDAGFADKGVPVGEAYPPTDTINYSEFDDLEADIGTQPIEGLDTEPSLIDIGRDKIDEIGQSISNALGTAYDAFNTTIDIAGKKINLASTAAKAIINKYIGGPVTVLIDALGAMDLPGGPTLQTSKAESIGLTAPGQTQDKYGINTQSAFGDYDKYNVDRVEELEGIVASQIARDKKNTIQMKELEDRNEYNTISGVGGDIQPDATDLDIATGVLTGDAAEAERIEAENRVALETAQRIENERAANVREEARIEAENRVALETAQQAAAERAEAEARARVREEAAQRDREDAANRAAAQQAAAERAEAEARARVREAARAGQGGGQGGGGYSGDPGGGAAGSPFSRGGRVRYSKGGIVDLLK